MLDQTLEEKVLELKRELERAGIACLQDMMVSDRLLLLLASQEPVVHEEELEGHKVKEPIDPIRWTRGVLFKFSSMYQVTHEFREDLSKEQQEKIGKVFDDLNTMLYPKIKPAIPFPKELLEDDK